MLAGHGYIVAIPEIYHEFEAAGEVFPYNQAGTDRGNVLKTTKELASYDADARAALDQSGADGVMVGRLKLAECEDGFIWREALRWQ